MYISHSPPDPLPPCSTSLLHPKKRKRVLDDLAPSVLALTTPNIQVQDHHQFRPSLKPLAWKRVRLSKAAGCVPAASTAPRAKLATASDALRSCHACHRRPTTSLQLSSYADCEVCGERACYVCLRECEGGGCRSGVSREEDEMVARQRDEARGRRICSRCCVESGVDGWVRCWVCFAGAEPAASDGERRGGG